MCRMKTIETHCTTQLSTNSRIVVSAFSSWWIRDLGWWDTINSM